MSVDRIKVTVSDPYSGEVLGEQIVENDYVLVVSGTCYRSNVQASGNGTHVITVKGRAS